MLERSARGYTPKTPLRAKTDIKKNIKVKGVNLLIIRKVFTDNSTIGELFLNGEKFCDTLELPYIDNFTKKKITLFFHNHHLKLNPPLEFHQQLMLL